jgi:hypothetical protein
MDESVLSMTLLDKVKLIEKLKKLKKAEIVDKEEKLSKEIADLEAKRNKEIKELEEQLKREETLLDEAMLKALDDLFFRERRTYLMNRARLERKVEFTENSEESFGNSPRGESFLYSLSERIFAGENFKLREMTSFTQYMQQSDEASRLYANSIALQDSSYLEDLARAQRYEEVYSAQSSISKDSYQNNKSVLEKMEEEMSKRNYY